MSVLRWHEDASEPDDQPAIPGASLSWMPSLGTPDLSALSPDLRTEVVHSPEVALVRSLKKDEALSKLLLSIEGTVLARYLEGIAAPVRRPPQSVGITTSPKDVTFAKLPPRPIPLRKPPAAKLAHTRLVLTPPYSTSARLMPSLKSSCLSLTTLTPKANGALPGSEGNVSALPAAMYLQPSGPVVLRKAYAAQRTPTFLVQTPSRAARVLPMPPPGAPLRRRSRPTLITGAPNSLPAAMAPQALPLRSASAHVTVLPAILPRPSTLAEGDSTSAVTPARLSKKVNRVGGKIVLAFQRSSQAGKQLSTGMKQRIETRSALAIERVGHTSKVLSIEIKSWLKTSAAPTVKRTGRAMARGSSRLKDGLKTRSVVTADLIVRAGKQLSIWHENWTDSRSSSRLRKPPVVAYCWTADTPDSLKIADISSGGVYLLTDARWPRGSTISMTLQRTDKGKQTPGSWLVIDFMVIRWCEDGLAGAFIPPTPYSAARGTENYADPKTLKQFVRQLAAPAHA